MSQSAGSETGRAISLADLFELAPSSFGAAAAAAIVTSGALAPLQAAVLAELSHFPWQSFIGSLGTRSLELFQTHLSDILQSVWQKYREISEYRDTAKHPPEEVASVPMHEHTFTSKHQPCLEIVFRGTKHRVTFDIQLNLEVTELILSIQSGKIKSVQSGSLRGSGSISLGPVELTRKEFQPILLPGTLALGDGIQI